jgi:hypothetical protein
MRRSRLALLALALVLAVGPAGVGLAMYRWVDDDGEVHISTRLEDVPEKHRARATSIAAPGPSPHGSCASFPSDPKGGARVPFSLSKDHLIVVGCINGKGPFRFLLDTGWPPPSMVQPHVLEALGINFKKAMFLKEFPQSSGTVKTQPVVHLRSIQVGGASVGPIDVGTFSLTTEWDGALGQDFMSLFIVEVDNRRGVLTLTPR